MSNLIFKIIFKIEFSFITKIKLLTSIEDYITILKTGNVHCQIRHSILASYLPR